MNKKSEFLIIFAVFVFFSLFPFLNVKAVENCEVGGCDPYFCSQARCSACYSVELKWDEFTTEDLNEIYGPAPYSSSGGHYRITDLYYTVRMQKDGESEWTVVDTNITEPQTTIWDFDGETLYNWEVIANYTFDYYYPSGGYYTGSQTASSKSQEIYSFQTLKCNQPPVISSITDNPDPQAMDSAIAFGSAASDPDGDDIDLYVCNNPDCVFAPKVITSEIGDIQSIEDFEQDITFADIDEQITTSNPQSVSSDSIYSSIALGDYTVPSDQGEDLILAVWVAAEYGSDSEASSVTFNGSPMSKIVAASTLFSYGGYYIGGAFFWKEVDPGESGSIAASFPGSSVSRGSIHAVTLNNVDTSGPINATIEEFTEDTVYQGFNFDQFCAKIDDLSQYDMIITGGAQGNQGEIDASSCSGFTSSYSSGHTRDSYEIPTSFSSAQGHKESGGNSPRYEGWYTYDDINRALVSLVVFAPDPVTEEVGWTTGGDENWYQATDYAYDGSRSMASDPNLGGYEQSWIDINKHFEGLGQISFYWKVSSEESYDFLVFCINDDRDCSLNSGYTKKISGEVDWQLETYTILYSGTHSFRWLYGKDGGVADGSDKGWIDRIIFSTPAEDTLGAWTTSSSAVANDPSASYTCKAFNEIPVEFENGWNLFSPSVEEGIDISDMEAAGCSIGAVYFWDPVSKSYQIEDDHLEAGVGYWVAEDGGGCSFTVSGTPWSLSPTYYESGTYLIGAPFSPVKVSSLDGDCSLTISTQDGYGGDLQEVDVLMPCEAYWMQVESDCTFPEPEPKDYSPCPPIGDVDGDGDVDSGNCPDCDNCDYDDGIVACYTVGSYSLTEEQRERADVNGDGEVNITDAMLIGQYVNGTRTDFEACDCAVQGNRNRYWARVCDTKSACSNVVDGEMFGCLCEEENVPPDQPITVGETWNHCSFKEKSIPTLNWSAYSDSDGDPQAGYEIWLDDDSGFTDPKFNYVASSASDSYTLTLSDDDDSDWISDLAWNTTYYWQVRVRDDQGNWSDWSDLGSFTTPLHAYPWPDFTWEPQEPTEGEVATFDPDSSEVFGGASISSYLWTVTEGNAFFTNGTDETSHYPQVVFTTQNNKMKLDITDSDGYSCPCDEKVVTISLSLPEYREVSPTGWMRKLFARASGYLGRFLPF